MTTASSKTDEELVEAVCAGNKQLYEEIINRYQNKLHRYATYLTKDDQVGADVVQNAFIKAYINLNSFNTPKKFSSWIYRIAHNEAINILQKNKNQVQLNEQLDYDSGQDLEEDFIKNEIIESTNNCLDQMPLKYKVPLSLYYLEEKSYEEISDILRLPTSTIGTHISRAKKIMKALCQKNQNPKQ
jgi:RNA polymerase sigma-70 factor (ECF subfamily)